MPKYEAMKAGYRNLWDQSYTTALSDGFKVADAIIKDKARYQKIEDATGVPWYWIACVHNRESNRNFGTYLGNGQKLTQRTTITPKGRGPFSTFEAGAIDAIKYKELDKIKDWPLERVLYEFERYNGFGYIGKINSPYVWAATNKQERGKYVADGKYDGSHWDTQLGCAAILKCLEERDPEVAARLKGQTVPKPVPDVSIPKEPPVPLDPKPTPCPKAIVLSDVPIETLIKELLDRGVTDLSYRFDGYRVQYSLD